MVARVPHPRACRLCVWAGDAGPDRRGVVCERADRPGRLVGDGETCRAWCPATPELMEAELRASLLEQEHGEGT